jgi:hypothetical protein
MKKRETNHRNQLELPLGYPVRKNDINVLEIDRIRLKKELLNQSASWHKKRTTRVFAMINRLNKRPYSTVSESRIKRLRNLAGTMLDRVELERKWHYAFKDEIYEVI